MSKIHDILDKIYESAKGYTFIFIIAITLLVVFLVVYFAMRKEPEKKTITELYDSTGHKQEMKVNIVGRILVVVAFIILILLFFYFLKKII